MEESVRNMLKQLLNMTDEDIDRMSPGIQKLASSGLPYKIIAEVTDAKYCFAGCKVGDKIVIGPSGSAVNREESTCPLCLGALAPLLERVHLMWDRIAEGLNPNEGWLRHSVCFDPGLERGGLGSVTFKVYAEKVG
jgi:hypothetical protein